MGIKKQKSDRKIEFFTFTVLKIFGWIFAHFQRIRTQHIKFSFYDTHIE